MFGLIIKFVPARMLVGKYHCLQSNHDRTIPPLPIAHAVDD